MNQAQLDETARWGREWQSEAGWESHTVASSQAKRIAAGYVRLLENLGVIDQIKRYPALGIGSGAGYLEAALTSFGITTVASEWSEEGMGLLARENPHLQRILRDVTAMNETNAWGLIVCRELYPFTRVNEFERQMNIISGLVDALAPEGVLLLVGSDVSKPECLDYARMMRVLGRDARVQKVFGPVLEMISKRAISTPLGGVGYRLQSMLGEALVWVLNSVRKQKLAAIRIYVVQKHGAGSGC